MILVFFQYMYMFCHRGFLVGLLMLVLLLLPDHMEWASGMWEAHSGALSLGAGAWFVCLGPRRALLLGLSSRVSARSHTFTARTEELQELKTTLKDWNSAVVLGPSCSGKSVLVETATFRKWGVVNMHVYEERATSKFSTLHTEPSVALRVKDWCCACCGFTSCSSDNRRRL
jgi:hypothetical protein